MSDIGDSFVDLAQTQREGLNCWKFGDLLPEVKAVTRVVGDE